MPKADSLQGSFDLLVLKTLSRRPRLRGYAVMAVIQDMDEACRVRAQGVTEESRRQAVTSAVNRVLRTA